MPIGGATIRTYLPLLDIVDAGYTAADKANPGIIPCRAGCNACCSGPFDISTADIVVLIDALNRLPTARRHEVRSRARDQLDRILGLEPDWPTPYHIAAIGEERFDRIAEQLADLPCPLLDSEGHCSVYSQRPMVCRLMGLGWINEGGEEIANDCPIQDDFPGYATLPPVPIPLTAMERGEHICRALAADALFGTPGHEEYETPIAAAICAWSTDPTAGANGPSCDKIDG